jgi:alkyl hydroperoxide reductase subunit AhpC
VSLDALGIRTPTNDISAEVLFFNPQDWTSVVTTLLSEAKKRIGTDEVGREGFRR